MTLFEASDFSFIQHLIKNNKTDKKKQFVLILKMGIGRFYLRFEGDALGTTEQSLKELHIYADADNKTIVINGQLLSNTNFKLFDIHGRPVRTTELDVASSNQIIDTSQLSTAVYILELVGDAYKKHVQKVVIK